MFYPFKILNKRKYSLLYFNAFLYNICIYSFPIIMATFLTFPFTTEKFINLILLISIFKLLERVFNIIWIIKGYSFIDYTKNDLYLAYFKRICNMNTSKKSNIHTGYLKKQMDIVVNETGDLLDGLMLTLNGFLIGVTLFLIETFRQDKLIFLIAIIFIIIIVLYNLLLSKKNTIAENIYNKKTSKYNSLLVDFLQNTKIIKNYDCVEYTANSINDKFQACKKIIHKINIFKTLRFDGVNGLISIMYIIVLLNLLSRMESGIEVFSYIIFYTTIFNNLSTELNDISRLFIRFNRFKSANNEIEKSIVENEALKKIKKWKTITIRNICFKYNVKDINTINIPFFSLTKKDKVCITGESGQGKSTFLSLFSRFYNIEDDNYLIDDIPSSNVPDIVYISQETDLFDLSIKENLCLGKNISNEVLRNYLDDAGLLEWVDSLEYGIDTIVGEKGVKISTGQKQRLNLIRGILLDKEIYLLDEPTSNLDNISEEKIYNMIKKYLKDKTYIIITHRPKIIEICNKHYHFSNRTMSIKNTRN